MSRRVYLLGVGLALALAVTNWALSLQPGVTEANCRRIRPGMTLAEVETLLGEPGAPGGCSGVLRAGSGGSTRQQLPNCSR
jgi:hypothetical protein